MSPIKITGFDPDRFEKPDPEPSSRPVRRKTSDDPAPRTRVEAPPREVRKPVDQKTADHLLHKYGLKNVKYTQLAPKKASVKQKPKSTGPRQSADPDSYSESGGDSSGSSGQSSSDDD